ncbi:hypothetical protein O7599_05660 [Streptomyces sp. WMMC500]|uniref:hypothetical protein n=1 Tax=Streptomyces sp. WMMC500 TaxID=3015154 RepID=UPI00248B27F1|nr:hypothetical protein [Streptomyces sp. WMMC500]WBB62026.1 hypothetical protein O7599_05660 [Streptomyces sp. WMMC500]
MKHTATSWISGICLLALLPAVAACSEGSRESQKSGASTATEPTSEASRSQEGGPSAQATSRDTAAEWVAAIVQDRARRACLLMGTARTGSTPAKANTKEMCSGRGTEAEEARNLLHDLHASFALDPPRSSPEVVAEEVPESGGTATFGGDQVTVDGQTLEAVMLSNSSGVEDSELELEIVATEIDGRWYVTDLPVSVG